MTKNVWNRIKNLTCEDIMRALKKDGWIEDETRGATRVFLHQSTGGRVVIHYHPKKTYGAKLLKGLISDIGWTEKDMYRLKLI